MKRLRPPEIEIGSSTPRSSSNKGCASSTEQWPSSEITLSSIF